MKQYTKYLTLKNFAIVGACYLAYKIARGVSAVGDTIGGAVDTTTSIGGAILNPLGAVTNVIKSYSASQKEDAKKEANRKAAVINAASTDAAIRARVDRCKTLVKQFTAKGKYPRVRPTKAIVCDSVIVDMFGAIQVENAGSYHLTPRVYGRDEMFIQTYTKAGLLVVRDFKNNKRFTVNPHMITLV